MVSGTAKLSAVRTNVDSGVLGEVAQTLSMWCEDPDPVVWSIGLSRMAEVLSRALEEPVKLSEEMQRLRRALT